jgi:hypothetical protein
LALANRSLGAGNLTTSIMDEHDDKKLIDKHQFEILANAISDIGYWSWWTELLPEVFQIEFGGTLLYFPPVSPDRPPQTKVAIRFDYPTSINFISKNQEDNFKWIQLLQEDKIESPGCTHGEFSFGNSELTKSLLQKVVAYKTVHGDKFTTENFLSEPLSLVFWCDTIGLAITAKEVKLLNHTGEIPLTDIADINKRWWEYWRTYWNKLNSNDPLPKDLVCEVTIPLKI